MAASAEVVALASAASATVLREPNAASLKCLVASAVGDTSSLTSEILMPSGAALSDEVVVQAVAIVVGASMEPSSALAQNAAVRTSAVHEAGGGGTTIPTTLSKSTNIHDLILRSSGVSVRSAGSRLTCSEHPRARIDRVVRSGRMAACWLSVQAKNTWIGGSSPQVAMAERQHLASHRIQTPESSADSVRRGQPQANKSSWRHGWLARPR